MDRKAIERLVQRWTRDAIADGRLDTFDELLSPDALDRTTAPPSRGVEPFKARTAAVRAAFAEIDVQIEDLMVDQHGEAIAWRWVLTGIHVGTFAGIAATGRRATLRGVNFQRLKGERVIEHWTLVDVFGAMQALRS
jgi:steroid delta-isomerase-like uncharacterized protein